jgi:hypothetical protein
MRSHWLEDTAAIAFLFSDLLVVWLQKMNGTYAATPYIGVYRGDGALRCANTPYINYSHEKSDRSNFYR